jgi:hypothetical protein
MKILVRTTFLLVALAACAVAGYAQGPKLQMDSLKRLEDSADKVVDVSLNERLMGMATRMLRKAHTDDEDAKKVIEAIAGIKEIYVRSYEFDHEGGYTPADVDLIRSQVKGPGWDRLIGVRSKRDGENAEVYTLSQGDKVVGVAIIAADPKRLTVVNIVGTIDVDRISDLDGVDLGMPRIELKREVKTEKPPSN